MLKYIKKTYPIVVLCLALGLMANDCEKSDKFRVKLIQGSDTFSVKDSIARLENSPFYLEVLLINQKGVFANFSQEPLYYYLPGNREPKGFDNIRKKVMAETYNRGQQVILTPKKFHYWFNRGQNADEQWHRFDSGSLQTKSGKAIGKRTVKQFYHKQTRETIPVSEMEEPVYLFFMATGKTQNKSKPRREIQREKMLIKWQ